jgi:hypothetical protein
MSRDDDAAQPVPELASPEEIKAWRFTWPRDAGRVAVRLDAGRPVTRDMGPVDGSLEAGWGVVFDEDRGNWQVRGLGY